MKVLQVIGEKLGLFYYPSKETLCLEGVLQILVQMSINGGLPEEIIFISMGEKRAQMLDYKGILFQCHFCKKHGHLQNECQLCEDMDRRWLSCRFSTQQARIDNVSLVAE